MHQLLDLIPGVHPNTVAELHERITEAGLAADKPPETPPAVKDDTTPPAPPAPAACGS